MRCIGIFLILWVELLLTLPATAQSVHISHCLERCPPVPDTGTEVVVRHLYVAAMDADGLAHWLAYRVLADSVGVASLLPRYWQIEELQRQPLQLAGEGGGDRLVQPDLSEAQDREYRINEVRIDPGSRGRLAPMSSFAGTPFWSELNNLSNMAPLPPDLRLGSWSRLDQAVNELVARTGELFVLTGTMPVDPGQSRSWYKVLSDGESHAAFVFSEELPSHARYCEQTASIESIENALGYRLFPAREFRGAGVLTAELGCTE